jgi:hypothetical protein
VRYELVIRQHGVRKATSLSDGDEMIIHRTKGTVSFFRPDQRVFLQCVPYGSEYGMEQIVVRFPVKGNVALLETEVRDLVNLMNRFTTLEAQPLFFETEHAIRRYVFRKKEGRVDTRVRANRKDVIQVGLKNGIVDLHKAGALYRVGSDCIKVEPLGCFYFFLHDEVPGIIELVSAISDTGFEFLEEHEGILRFECVGRLGETAINVKRKVQKKFTSPRSKKKNRRKKSRVGRAA